MALANSGRLGDGHPLHQDFTRSNTLGWRKITKYFSIRGQWRGNVRDWSLSPAALVPLDMFPKGTSGSALNGGSSVSFPCSHAPPLWKLISLILLFQPKEAFSCPPSEAKVGSLVPLCLGNEKASILCPDINRSVLSSCNRLIRACSGPNHSPFPYYSLRK